MSSGPATVTSIEDIAAFNHLKDVWKKEVRPALRRATFRDANLAPDPLYYAAYEWGLDQLLGELSRDLRLGRYVAEKAEIVRAAKGTGLSRPMCYLTARDALVYRSITILARKELTQGAREWVGFQRSDKGSASPSTEVAVDSFDWFSFWLEREGGIAKLVDDRDITHFVESDIANFFPSIRMDAIREHLHSVTRLSKEVVRLCIQVIDGAMPRTDYSEVSMLGLPQESVGSSRELAHGLLQHVDDELDSYGKRGRYMRFMDDMIIGVESYSEGEKCVSLIQRSLETLGLYPNSAKTKIVTVKSYLHEALAETNSELERCDALLDSVHPKTPETTKQEILDDCRENVTKISESHRNLTDRPRRWDRVTRRLYTLQRRLGLTDWQATWPADLLEYPSSAAHILEYVRAFPLTVQSVSTLARCSTQTAHLYSDVSLLAAETIASAPVGSDTDGAWSQVYSTTYAEFMRVLGLDMPAPDRERIACGWLVAAWKYANAGQRTQLLESTQTRTQFGSVLRAQALPMHVSIGGAIEEWIAARPGVTWESALNLDFLRALLSGDARAIGVSLSAIEPIQRLVPMRYIIPARSMPLVDILGRISNRKFSTTAPRLLKRLRENEGRLRDLRMESLLQEWVT